MALDLGRIYHDPAVPELVCRYPEEPTVTVLRTAPREVVGQPRPTGPTVRYWESRTNRSFAMSL